MPWHGFRWIPVDGGLLPDMATADRFLASFSDGGANPDCEWRRATGGDRTRANYVCAAHIGCTVRVCKVVTSRAEVQISRLAGTEHALACTVYDRKNASLTKAQKRSLLVGRRVGANASDMLQTWEEDADRRAKAATGQSAPLRQGAGATGLEGECSANPFCTYFCILLHMCALEYICCASLCILLNSCQLPFCVHAAA